MSDPTPSKLKLKSVKKKKVTVPKSQAQGAPINNQDGVASYLGFKYSLEQIQKVMDPGIFYLYYYKTSFCLHIKSKPKHNWQTCIYAHSYSDFRRPPQVFYYDELKCPYIKSYGQGNKCPKRLTC